MTTALLCHAHPSVVGDYERSLGCRVVRVQSRASQFSAGYVGLARDYPTPEAYLRAHLAGATPPYVLLGFSAGCWLVRAWLRDEETRAQTVAAVLLDGLHASGDDRRATLSARHDGVLAFGRLALASPGRHALVITHSQIIPPGYASTRRTAQAVIEALGQRRDSLTDSLTERGLHVLAYSGGDATAHTHQLREVGPDVCLRLLQPLMHGAADTEPPPPTRRSLGERAVRLALSEVEREPVPGRETLARYFAGCERDGQPGLGAFLAAEARAGRRPNHCAAAASYCAFTARLAGETLPHRWRASAKELRSDAIASHSWHEVSECRAGIWYPEIGDLAIYDRAQANKPATSWWGHVDRVQSADSAGYENVGANEGSGGVWRAGQRTPYSAERLLGFVAYPRPRTVAPLHLLSDAQVRDVLALRDLTISQVIAEAPWRS